MFGFIYTAVVGACKAINAGQKIGYDIKSSSKALRDGNDTYFDHNGAKRLVSTNEVVYFDELPNGERVLKKINGTIVKNYDSAKKEKNIRIINEKLRAKGSEFILLGTIEDVFPDYRQSLRIASFIAPKIAVFEKSDSHEFYVKKRTGNIYVSLSNGKYYCYEDISPEFIYIAESHNSFIDEHSGTVSITGKDLVSIGEGELL